MDDQRRERITFAYERGPEYRTVYANGAHGGITPKGEYRFDLFFEYPKAPRSVAHSVTPDGLGPEVDRTPPDSAVARELQVGVVMTPDGAKSLAHWILESIRQYEEKRRTRED